MERIRIEDKDKDCIVEGDCELFRKSQEYASIFFRKLRMLTVSYMLRVLTVLFTKVLKFIFTKVESVERLDEYR